MLNISSNAALSKPMSHSVMSGYTRMQFLDSTYEG